MLTVLAVAAAVAVITPAASATIIPKLTLHPETEKSGATTNPEMT